MKRILSLLVLLALLACNPGSIKEGGDCDPAEFEIIETMGHASISDLDSILNQVDFQFYEAQGDTFIYVEDFAQLKWPPNIPFPRAIKDSFSLSIKQYGRWHGSCGFKVDSSQIHSVSEKLNWIDSIDG
mgnify:CR=1 FL=1